MSFILIVFYGKCLPGLMIFLFQVYFIFLFFNLNIFKRYFFCFCFGYLFQKILWNKIEFIFTSSKFLNQYFLNIKWCIIEWNCMDTLSYWYLYYEEMKWFQLICMLKDKKDFWMIKDWLPDNVQFSLANPLPFLKLRVGFVCYELWFRNLINKNTINKQKLSFGNVSINFWKMHT